MRNSARTTAQSPPLPHPTPPPPRVRGGGALLGACLRCSSRKLLRSFSRAGRRNPGLVWQLRLSWAMVYFGSPTFLGFAMTAACSHWLDGGQRGGTLVQRLAPSYNVTCLVNSRKYVVKGIKTENMKSTH